MNMQESIDEIAEAPQMRSLIADIENPDAAPDDQSDPNRGQYAALKDFAVLLWRVRKFDAQISGGFNNYDTNYSAQICALDHQWEFKDYLFKRLLDCKSAQIFFDEFGGPKIYEHTNRLIVWTETNEQSQQKNEILKKEWYRVLRDLCASGARLVSEEYLENRDAIPFSVLEPAMQQQHFDTIWKNEIVPALYPRAPEPDIQPKKRLGQWLKDRLGFGGGNQGDHKPGTPGGGQPKP